MERAFAQPWVNVDEQPIGRGTNATSAPHKTEAEIDVVNLRAFRPRFTKSRGGPMTRPICLMYQIPGLRMTRWSSSMLHPGLS